MTLPSARSLTLLAATPYFSTTGSGCSCGCDSIRFVTTKSFSSPADQRRKLIAFFLAGAATATKRGLATRVARDSGSVDVATLRRCTAVVSSAS